jgi:archaemetzincin
MFWYKRLDIPGVIFLVFLFAYGLWKNEGGELYVPETGAYSRPPTTIGLLQMSRKNIKELDSLCDWFNESWDIQTRMLPSIPIPGNIPANAQMQLDATAILRFLGRVKPKGLTYLLAFTTEDLFVPDSVKPISVLGLAPVGGRAAIISTHRMPFEGMGQKSIMERLIKVTLHELGHVLGLNHCHFSSICIMQETLATRARFDRVELYLCDRCRIPFIAEMLPRRRSRDLSAFWIPIPGGGW